MTLQRERMTENLVDIIVLGGGGGDGDKNVMVFFKFASGLVLEEDEKVHFDESCDLTRNTRHGSVNHVKYV